jgi:hypothetical protein
MKLRLFLLLSGFSALTPMFAQTVLSDFDAAPLLLQNSWETNYTVNGGLLTIGGTSTTNGAFFDLNPIPSWSSFNAVEIVARVDEGNQATSFNFYVDTNGGTPSFAIPVATSQFGSTLSAVTINLGSLGAVGPNAIEVWGITTEAAGSTPFRMTFDSISLTTAVPEPSTYAAILGFVTLGLVGYRRFRRR